MHCHSSVRMRKHGYVTDRRSAQHPTDRAVHLAVACTSYRYAGTCVPPDLHHSCSLPAVHSFAAKSTTTCYICIHMTSPKDSLQYHGVPATSIATATAHPPSSGLETNVSRTDGIFPTLWYACSTIIKHVYPRFRLYCTCCTRQRAKYRRACAKMAEESAISSASS